MTTQEAKMDKWMEDWLSYDQPLHPALEPWVRSGTVLGPMVKHPYVFTTLGDERVPGLVKQANEIYQQKRKMRREFLDEKKWWPFIFLLIERPWQMRMLEKLWNNSRITLLELVDLLPDVWKETEAPQANQDEPMELFRAAGFVTDDSEGWGEIAMRDSITLYRGVDGQLELTADGPSWTMNLEVAKFFAHRLKAGGTVYGYEADPYEALAYFTGREEAEIILDFDGLSDRERIYKVST